jgi:putative oxygen-independent coproporphyrinogen III oxidase
MNAEALFREIAAIRQTAEPKPLQIYLHIPFCSSKCHFCDWVDDIPVEQLRSGPVVRRRYVEALRRQIEFWGPHLTAVGYRPTSVYWGGGTPTRLDPEELDATLRALRAGFDLGSLSQHTIESTPNDLTEEKLARLKSFGVDRLSIGVQSFDPDQLRRAGRAHSVEQARSAVALAKQSGFGNVNMDLISGFPEEALSTFRHTLDAAVDLGPAHITVYSYRATPRTTMAMQVNRGIRQAIGLDAMIESYELTQEVLTRAGYEEYCFNCFAREPRFQFKAGLYAYALEGDIIGFGAGARSLVGTMSLFNADTNLHRFMDSPFEFDSVDRFTLDQPERLFPLFGGALLTRDGLSFSRFEYITGIPFSAAWQNRAVKAWFQYIENCGARLIFESDRVYSPDRDVHRAYLKNLAYTLNPALLTTVSP